MTPLYIRIIGLAQYFVYTFCFEGIYKPFYVNSFSPLSHEWLQVIYIWCITIDLCRTNHVLFVLIVYDCDNHMPCLSVLHAYL